MSVILEALQKARREGPEKGRYSEHEVIDVPVRRGPPRRRKKPGRAARKRTIIASVAGVLVIAGIAGGIWFYQAHFGQKQPVIYLVAQGTPGAGGSAAANRGSVASLPVAGSAQSAAAPAGTPVAARGGLVVETVSNTNYEAPLPTPLPISGTAAQPAADDLPPPVPLNDLNHGVDAAAVNAALPKPGPSPTVVSAPELKLGSILYDGSYKSAMINGIVVHEGKDYGDFFVDKIAPNQVTVHRPNEQPTVLRLR